VPDTTIADYLVRSQFETMPSPKEREFDERRRIAESMGSAAGFRFSPDPRDAAKEIAGAAPARTTPQTHPVFDPLGSARPRISAEAAPPALSAPQPRPSPPAPPVAAVPGTSNRPISGCWDGVCAKPEDTSDATLRAALREIEPHLPVNFPLDPAEQRRRFCTTFTTQLNLMKSGDAATRKRGQILLLDAVKKAPCNRLLPDAQGVIRVERPDLKPPLGSPHYPPRTRACAATLAKLPESDPRHPRWARVRITKAQMEQWKKEGWRFNPLVAPAGVPRVPECEPQEPAPQSPPTAAPGAPMNLLIPETGTSVPSRWVPPREPPAPPPPPPRGMPGLPMSDTAPPPTRGLGDEDWGPVHAPPFPFAGAFGGAGGGGFVVGGEAADGTISTSDLLAYMEDVGFAWPAYQV